MDHRYTAGLFDGEGTITLSGKDGQRYPTVSVSSTTYELVDYLKTNYGGYICKHKTDQTKHKKSYSWRMTYNDALWFCSKIHKYVREPSKARRIKLVLEEYKYHTPRNGKYTEDELYAKLNFELRFFHPSTP